MDCNELKAELAGIQPALIWNKGGYYYLTIKHLGAAGKTAEYGLVRNHVYTVEVSGIEGLGTPVYDPDEIIIPEQVEHVTSNIAARINVLSWKIVSQSVTLK